MTNDELRAQAQKSSALIKIGGGFWLGAFMIVMVASIVYLVLAVMSGSYYANSKAVRDAAEVGTGLLSQLGSIEAVTDWVLPFTFLGIATFIAGFGFAFSNILKNIRLRANTMAAALPELKARKSQ